MRRNQRWSKQFNRRITISYFDDNTKKPYEYFETYLDNKLKSFNIPRQTIKENIDKIRRTIDRSWNRLKNNEAKKVLIVGHVQGGKTDCAIGLNSKIIEDNNQTKNIFIHITFSNTKLSNQTYERFSSFFNNRNIDKSSISILKKEKKMVDSFKRKINSNQNLLLFLMKERSSIRMIDEIINYLENEFSEEYRIFIFDDEGDYASFNTHGNTKKDEEYEELSKTFKWLSSIIKKDNVSYVSITATPMVHFLANDNNSLKPDYAFFLPKGYGYTGIEEFMERIDESNNIFSVIDENSNESLMMSIILFFIKCLFVETRDIEMDDKETKPIMIINPGSRKNEHLEQKDNIENLIEYLLNNEKLLIEKIKEYNLLSYLDKSLHEIIETKRITVEEISKSIIKKCKNKYKVIVFNSDSSEENEMLDFESSNSMIRFVVGYLRLSRGVTFKNLLQAYISYSPRQKNIDNIMQQCRWFGYRSKYIQHISLFMHKDYVESYRFALDMSNDMYWRLKSIEDNNGKFSEIGRYLKLTNSDDNLPTKRRTKATYNKRAKQDQTIVDVVPNKIIKNSLDIYNKNEEEMLFLKQWFDKHHNLIAKRNDYDSIVFNSYNDFVDSLNKTKNVDLNFVFGNRYSSIEKHLLSLNQKTIVRFINKNKDIEFKRRVVTGDTGKHIYWGNGTYSDSDEGITSNSINIIDLIPIKIYEKDSEDKNIKLYRLKLNVNYSLAKRMNDLSSEENSYLIPNED